MKEEQVKGLFAVAQIPVLHAWKLENGYWPDSAHYDDVRKSHPWWLIKTPYGLIKIGWRKRVISISWEHSSLRCIVTSDNVTKSESYVHAYSIEKAVTYLTVLNDFAKKQSWDEVNASIDRYLNISPLALANSDKVTILKVIQGLFCDFDFNFAMANKNLAFEYTAPELRPENPQ